MAIVFTCTHCNCGIKTSDAASGRRGRCPRCKQTVVVPALMPLPLASTTPNPDAAQIAATPLINERKVFRKGRALVASTVIVILVVSILTYWIRKKTAPVASGNAPAALREMAAVLPDDLAMVVTTYAHDRSPVSISEINGLLDRMPDWKKEIEESRENSRASSREVLGFDPQDDKAWRDAGIDPGKPITACLTAVDVSHLDLAENTIFVLLPSNIAAAEKTIRKVWEDSTDSQINELLHHEVKLPQPRLLASVCSGPRLFAKQKSSEDSERKLREFVSTGAAHPLASNPNFIRCQSELPVRADTVGFINLASILRTLPKDRMPEFVSAIHAAAFASSYEEQDAFILLDESELLKQLRPGGESREFLAGFDPPLAALSFSIADLAEFGRAFRRTLGDTGTKNQQHFDFDSGDFDPFLKDSCGGVLIYPDQQKSPSIFPFAYAAFLRVHDTAAYQSVRAKHPGPNLSGRDDATKQVFGQNVLYIDEKHGSASAMIGEYLVHGTAVAQITALAKGTAKGWHAAVGGRSVLEFQIPIAAGMQYLARNESAEIQKVVHDKLDDSVSFIGHLDGGNNGLRYHAEYHGLYAAMLKLAPELKALSTAPRK